MQQGNNGKTSVPMLCVVVCRRHRHQGDALRKLAAHLWQNRMAVHFSEHKLLRQHTRVLKTSNTGNVDGGDDGANEWCHKIPTTTATASSVYILHISNLIYIYIIYAAYACKFRATIKANGSVTLQRLLRGVSVIVRHE